MSTELTLLGNHPAQLPAAILQAMGGQTTDEMQQNVGQSFAVVTIKGKTFGIRYGGNTTPLTVTYQGQQFAAPYFDVVLVKARGELSKTWYAKGYTEGDDAQPDCYSEDGVTPLGPVEKRPKFDEMAGPLAGQPCTNCQMCPMNRFGSKPAQPGQEAGRGKACADTRKVVVLPMKGTGAVNADGSEATVLDAENAKFGGGMLLRVPAASLKVFAEYSSKLQAMGVPYYAVVTRMKFDTSAAFPKFELQATRYLSNEEANELLGVREGQQVKQILESGQLGAAPSQATALPAPQGQIAPAMAASAPAPLPAPQGQIAPSPTVVPLHPQAPTPMAPVGAPIPPELPPVAPAPVQAAPMMPAPVAPAPMAPVDAAAAAGVRMKPNAPYSFEQYIAANWTPQQIVEAQYGEWIAAPAAPAPLPPAPMAPAPVQAPPAANVLPAAPLQASPNLMSDVDRLLAS